MKLKKIFLFVFAFFCLAGSTSAQYDEVGIMIGASNYKGELSPHLFNTDFLHPAVGVFFRHNWNRHWSYSFELNYGRISGDDALAETGFEKNRNLSFYSDILEVSPHIEFNFFPYETGNMEYPFTPYLFTGLSVFRFNPKAELNGETYELQPLGTEGQGLSGRESLYNRITMALAVGGGIKVNLGHVGVGIEVGARRAYSDYLDDVSTTYPDQAELFAARGQVAVDLSDRSINSGDPSIPVPSIEGKQRGVSRDNDWFVFTGVTLYYRINSPGRDSCHPFRKETTDLRFFFDVN